MKEKKINLEKFETKEDSNEFGTLLKKIRSEVNQRFPTESEFIKQFSLPCRNYQEGNCNNYNSVCEACNNGEYLPELALNCKDFEYVNPDRGIRTYNDIQKEDALIIKKREAQVMVKLEATVNDQIKKTEEIENSLDYINNFFDNMDDLLIKRFKIGIDKTEEKWTEKDLVDYEVNLQKSHIKSKEIKQKLVSLLNEILEE